MCVGSQASAESHEPVTRLEPINDKPADNDDITCPDQVSTCPKGTTCCPMKDGYYGCCQYENVIPIFFPFDCFDRATSACALRLLY